MTEEVKQQTPQNPEAEEAEIQKSEATRLETMAPGQVVKLEDVENNTQSIDSEDEELSQLYEKSFAKVMKDEIVVGEILEIGNSKVLVDIGYKSEGILSKEEFIDIDDFKVGDEVELFLESQEDPDGNVQVSRRKVYFLRAWQRLMNSFENDELVEGRIVRRIKGGFVVDLNGVDAFLPGSQVDVKPIRDFDALVGKVLEMKIVKVNEQRKNIVVSRRAIIEKEQESKRADILATLEKGQVRRGMVKNITDFGVFIDLGGVDGLLHITDLSWGRVNHPSEVVKLDEEIDVMILDFDKERQRISLGLKQLQPHPWDNIEERFPIGSRVKGKVVSLTDYGAFVELDTGIEGLIHVSEMSWSQHIKNPSQVLNQGDEVEAVVLNIEPESRKISLGLKQLTPDPWENIEEKFPVGSKHTGKVRNLTPFGAFVELEEGVDGLVHISDLSWTKKVRHPSEVIRKGQEIEVVVLDINQEERRIALGHKQVEPNPWDTFEDEYANNTETTGKISRLIDKGVIVTLPLGVDAFVPLNHIGKPNIKRAADYFKVGDELPLKVIEFDKENKRIVLSVSEYLKGKESSEVESYMAQHSLGATTLEELVSKVPGLEEEPEQGKTKKAPKKKTKATAETGEEKAEVKAKDVTAEKAKKAPKKADVPTGKAEKAEKPAKAQEVAEKAASPAEETEAASKAEAQKASAKKAKKSSSKKAKTPAETKAEDKTDAADEKKDAGKKTAE